jgi:hypothetical protein
MKIKCITNKARIAFEGTDLPFGTSTNSVYGVDVGSIYSVVGMHLYKGALSYFIFNESYPSLYPFQLFEIVDSKLPNNWHFRQIKFNEPDYIHTHAVWGYYEFCFDQSHYEGLIENEPSALLIFHQRLNEMKR